MKKLIKKIVLTVFIITLSYGEVFAIRVISRKTEGGRKNGYEKTSKELCQSSTGETGWCINCSGKGNENCPNSIAFHEPGNKFTEFDIIQANSGLQYALFQISNGINSGKYSYCSYIEIGELKHFEVNWQYSENEIGENINSLITVDRID